MGKTGQPEYRQAQEAAQFPADGSLSRAEPGGFGTGWIGRVDPSRVFPLDDVSIPMKPITRLNSDELEEIFSRASGPGGQNVNKVSTRVSLRHVRTGVTVHVQEARTQAANRRIARERLLESLIETQRAPPRAWGTSVDVRDRSIDRSIGSDQSG